MATKKVKRRLRIRQGIRRRLSGTSEKPRLSVFKSNKAIYAQIINDENGHTIVAASSKELGNSGVNVETAKEVGKKLAEKAGANGVKTVVFDRGGLCISWQGKGPGRRSQGRRIKFLKQNMSQSNIKSVKASEIDLKEKVVAIKRVAKVVKGGRRFSFSAIVVVGDSKGVVGYGLGKANEVTDAITKGIDDAKKNLVKVPVYKNTVPHQAIGKYGGGLVLLKPAAPGTGVIAGGAMRAVLESAGIKDVLAKSKGSSNPHNVVKATFNALGQMRDAYAIAQQRGVSLSKVFNG